VVTDNGQGIDEEHQAKIFDMFYRASERTKGSGLGLYILKRAVERLNGTIELTSKLNEGSTFVVKLPV
ncbi:MAG TPA: HAMP domain-containing sensor histidine kinase, partial [Cyclobacteriaceae bacterium]|nr:HAMP domain-containing sensor histidine kinase [Cyclobacteriaceae bacterium]